MKEKNVRERLLVEAFKGASSSLRVILDGQPENFRRELALGMLDLADIAVPSEMKVGSTLFALGTLLAFEDRKGLHDLERAGVQVLSESRRRSMRNGGLSEEQIDAVETFAEKMAKAACRTEEVSAESLSQKIADRFEKSAVEHKKETEKTPRATIYFPPDLDKEMRVLMEKVVTVLSAEGLGVDLQEVDED